ncbi:MAG: hypothetical protein WCG83_05720 [Candidatus Peregrinibacteria bacterium]
MQRFVESLRQTKSKEDCLRQTYDLLTTKYHGGRIQTVTKLWELYPRSIDYLWSKNGFLHCTNFNRLFRILLVQSGYFTDRDIVARWTLLWFFSPHQYIQIRVADDRWVDVDVRAAVFGIRFGDFAHGFHDRGAGNVGESPS